MPRLIQMHTRNDAVARAAVEVLGNEGVRGLTLRAIAREARLSPASLLHQYGTLHRTLEVAARIFARARLEELRHRCARSGLTAFLPESVDELVDARAWQGWVEMSRVHDRVALIVHSSRGYERTALADVTDFRLSDARLVQLAAVVDGLLAAVTLAEGHLPLQQAREALTAAADALLADAPPPPAPTEQFLWLVRYSPVRV